MCYLLGVNEPTVLHIAAQVHGRVLVREASDSPATLLVGFHGYGESGDIFLKALDEIPGTSAWHLVAIQALHPFYDRKMQTVVASWMTRQDRDLAIADNIAYVTQTVDEVNEQLDCSSPTVFVGFSQGTAMAYRAACLSTLTCDGLIALAGDVPSDVEIVAARKIPSVLIGRGTNDAWYDEPKLENDIARLTRMGSTVETCIFDGGHEWTDAFRTACGLFLERLSDPIIP